MITIIDSASDKLSILRTMREQHLDKMVIYSLDTCSDDQWLEMLKNAWCLTVTTDSGPAGIAWFDNIYGRTAQSHFCPFRDNFGQAATFGKDIIRWLEEKLSVKMLTGVIPVPFRQARRLMPIWGFTETLRMPDACFIAKYNRYVDGILYTRKS